MGKLNITGMAARECTYDQVTFYIQFKTYAETSNILGSFLSQY